MWSNLPFDLLADIFSYLSPDSFARAKSVCKNWCACAKSTAVPPRARQNHPPWFIALPTRIQQLGCYAHNPIDDNWHVLPLDFIPYPIRPVASVGGLVLLRFASSMTLQLAIFNPFTRQFRHLPMLNTTRTNPAVGVIEPSNSSHRFSGYRIYVAGGMSEAGGGAGGGASYVPTLEIYDSCRDKWMVIGSMPMEYAVRLTVWTPNESVHSNGVLYWITSARAYSVMGFEVGTRKWRQLSVPMGERLEFAALVPRKGKLTVVGGGACSGGGTWVWELGEGDDWSVIEKVPLELGMRLLGGTGSWGNVKCVGIDGAVCLYRDVGAGMVVWRGCVENGRWEWSWVEGCSIRGNQLHNFPIKGLMLHPNLGFCT